MELSDPVWTCPEAFAGDTGSGVACGRPLLGGGSLAVAAANMVIILIAKPPSRDA
jgi:hypothetical protein